MFSIPGLEKFNGSYFDAYKAIYSLCAHEVTKLRTLFPEGAINDVDGYKVGIITKEMYAFHSLMTIIEKNQDYSTSASILRSIADNLSTYILIYHQKTRDEILLRHYMYLIDGLNVRYTALCSIRPSKNAPISNVEKEETERNVSFAKKNTLDAMHFCKEKIMTLKIYHEKENVINHLLKTKNGWRYKSLDCYHKILNWKDMYPLINGKESSQFFISYLSQYVHGLSSSNLMIDTKSKETFEPLIGIGITFLGKIHEFAQNDFPVEKGLLMQGFFQSEYGIEHMSYITPSYLEDLITKL